ncbi:Hemolysin activation/secretion protein [Azotobacter beijerinckii]|uniref:Hemolysin activation/secretion protein n=2 Tax=Azotobacter beijerinckii TaxID=170623 RepID=A0A1H6QZX2_9GAMM|nr:Hemolysin activation/secretion protein [Azotobacter beijerinckii]
MGKPAKATPGGRPTRSPSAWRRMALAGLLVCAGQALWAAPRLNESDLQRLPGSQGNLCVGCTPEQRLEAPAGGEPAQPAAPPAGGPTFELREVRFRGATQIPAQRLQALAAEYVGRPVGLAQLDELAQRVTGLYRDEGYFLAQALVPVQTVRDGVVEISVLEGKLGRIMVELDRDAPLSEEWVRRYLAALQPGQPLRAASYERAMLLLSDQPGIQVRSGLQEGVEPGTADLVVEVTRAPRWSFAANADNHGTRETGRNRIGASTRWASPSGVGDNLDLNGLLAEHNDVNYGRIAYERPLNGDGLRAGLAFSRVEYNLGGQLSELDATGTAYLGEALLSWPLLRQRSQNLLLRGRLEYRDLEDRFDEFDWKSRKDIYGAGLGWAWERRDGWLGGGYWASSGEGYFGHLNFRGQDEEEADRGPYGLHTGGDFFKLGGNLARLQALAARHSLYWAVGFQLASRNLDSSEKLALGGPHAVRGYASSEMLVDDGLISNLEWRWSASESLTPYLFYDFGRGRQMHDAPFPGENWRTLTAAGLGLAWAQPGDFLVNLSLAWRLTGPGETDKDRQPRLFVELQKWL